MDPNREPYHQLLERWMPGVHVGRLRGAPAALDALVTWRGPIGRIQYVLEEKRHLGTLDARMVAEQLHRLVRELPAELRRARPLLIAPYIRPQQAAIFEKADVDFIDQAGNAHLEGPGLHVHVEGRKPPKEHTTGRVPMTKGWVKIVMALLIQPDLLHAPYRAIAGRAGVALGTVARCFGDLRARGLIGGENERRRFTDLQELVPFWVEAYIDRLRPTLKERRLQVQNGDKPELWQRLHGVLMNHHVGWALTGADAAEQMTNYFRAENTEIYAAPDVFENRMLLKELRAQPAARIGNLLVIEPPAPVVTAAQPRVNQQVPTAPVLLVYAELRYRGTDQAREAAELLLPRLIGDANA